MGSRGKAGTIYTIGSSTRAFSEFLELLRMYEIATLVDVRISPYSKRFPHFSKQSLEELLPSQTVGYVYLGKELGGYRREGYEAYMQSAKFARGIEALEAVGQGAAAAFMCSERLPWKCHRRFIASALERRGWRVIHIIEKDRTWEPQSASE
ncbi:MAG: DUF488 family protein [Candidatus Methylomirabilales bacterium]